MQPFPQRMSGGQPLQLGCQGVVQDRPKRQVSLDPGLQGGQPQVFQAHGLRLNERVVGQVGEHLAPPQIQRLAQRPGALRVPARLHRGPPGGEPVLEPRRIQVLAIGAEQVATAPGHQHAPARRPGAGPARARGAGGTRRSARW